MSQLAIFTAPKAFRDAHISMIQHNAIRSWQQMGAEVEIYLLGDEEGIAKVAAELEVQHLAKVERNQRGTPLVSSLFQRVREASDAPLLAYVNADIVLFPEALDVVNEIQVAAEKFVLMGQRYDLNVKSKIEFDKNWTSKVQAELDAKGKMHPPGGSDYFIFPRQLYMELPDFAIGRAGWDNWMIYEALRRSWRPVDATASLTAIHQNHDYAHLPEGQAHYRVAETEENTEMAGGMRQIYSLLDLKLEYRNGAIQVKRPSLLRLVRGMERVLQPDERVGKGWRWALLRRLRKLRRSLVASRSN
jgi:hypothetical protein